MWTVDRWDQLRRAVWMEPNISSLWQAWNKTNTSEVALKNPTTMKWDDRAALEKQRQILLYGTEPTCLHYSAKQTELGYPWHQADAVSKCQEPLCFWWIPPGYTYIPSGGLEDSLCICNQGGIDSGASARCPARDHEHGACTVIKCWAEVMSLTATSVSQSTCKPLARAVSKTN